MFVVVVVVFFVVFVVVLVLYFVVIFVVVYVVVFVVVSVVAVVFVVVVFVVLVVVFQDSVLLSWFLDYARLVTAILGLRRRCYFPPRPSSDVIALSILTAQAENLIYLFTLGSIGRLF